MYLERLAVHGIRNIDHAELFLSPGANLIFGHNGSGKTSLLEAVHLLSRGRSFRSNSLKSVISHHIAECTCFGLINGDTGGQPVPIGVSRSSDGAFVFKLDGNQVTSASRLAEALPLQLINATSFLLLDGPPSARRGFMDWGVFHVEHSYRELWSRFQKCLKQRNSLLRHGKMDDLQLSVWDREFTAIAEPMDEARIRHIESLVPVLQQVIQDLGLKGEFSFRYVPGWDHSKDLLAQLQAAHLRDRKAGFTNLGPHRADLRILRDGQPASEVMSRGQAKMLVCAMKIAQSLLLRERTGRQCIFLLDDLPSELDARHRQAVCESLMAMEVQILVTAVELRDLDSFRAAEGALHKPALFHVEQGKVSQASA